MVNESFLKKMKQGSVLINLSRGEVMDVNAVAKAITNKHLGGLAADVFPSNLKVQATLFIRHCNISKTYCSLHTLVDQPWRRRKILV